jgi:predicted transcriptional regulator
MPHLNTNLKSPHFRHSAVASRISALLNIFHDGQPHKAAELAQRIGVNSRTIRRTLHLMRDEMGVPIIAGREGFQMQNLDARQTEISGQSNSGADVHTGFWHRETAPQHN